MQLIGNDLMCRILSVLQVCSLIHSVHFILLRRSLWSDFGMKCPHKSRYRED